MKKTRLNKLLAIILALMMFVPLTMNAKAGEITNDLYSVKVYVPKGVTGENGLTFYPTIEFDEENHDTFEEGAAITALNKDTKTDDKYDIYSMTLNSGIYSFRAEDAKGKSLGGGAFTIPAEAGGGTYQSKDDTKIYLRRADAYITYEDGGSKVKSSDYSVTMMNKIGTVTMGEPYVNASGYDCYPVLTYVNGNALLYYAVFTPSKTYASENNLGLSIWKNYAVQADTDIVNFAGNLKKTSTFTINTPKDAEASLYTQILNFNSERIDSIKTVELSNGTVDHVFNISRSSDMTYRVSMEGMRTKAGFINNVDGDRLEVKFDASESTKEQDASGKSFSESSMLLNINERNKLDLKVGEKYKVRAYRAAWQIVQTITDNIMVEPDFHYNIISGDDVISIDTIDGGNAKDNWAWVTAEKEGAAIVEVSYDALNVNDNGRTIWETKSEGFYGASNPIRTGVFVVTVGDKYKDVSGMDWDAEYNTCYFLEDKGTLRVEPAGNQVSVYVASVFDGELSQWSQVSGDKNGFDVPINPGNNIIRIESDGFTDYRVVRGAKLKVIIDNNVEGRDEIYPGDTISVSLEGLYMPLPKLAGIYNPGFPNTANVSFELDGTRYSSKGTQYHIIQPDTNAVNIEVPETAANFITLKSGKISISSMGSPYGAHRVLTDVGVPANFNAASLPMRDIPLPDININIDNPRGLAAVSDNEVVNTSINDNTAIGTNKTHISSYYPTTGLEFDLTEDETDGYAVVSFEDYGVRLDGADFKTPLGVIISPTQVPYKEGDNIAVVTLRLLDALDIGYKNTGSLDSAFYLASIENFKLSNGTQVDSFGEFDSGSGSGWMITQNNWYINSSTADFKVEDGDIIRWQNTCQIGADIGCDWDKRSAEIIGLRFYENFGELSPAFDNNATEYIYRVPSSAKTIRLEAIQENYWSVLTCTSNGKAYKPMAPIPVEDGTVIELNCAFAEYAGDEPTDTDTIRIKIELSDTTTSPNEKISRGRFTVLMGRAMLGTDVYTEDDSIKWAVDAGITDGMNKDLGINREQLVTMLYRYKMAAGKDVRKKSDMKSYSDINDVSPWSADAMSWAFAEGIIGSNSESKIMPKAGVSALDAEDILKKFVKFNDE